MNDIIMSQDNSYCKRLASEFDPLTAGLEDADMKDTVLIVDTGAMYIYYKGSWYEQ